MINDPIPPYQQNGVAPGTFHNAPIIPVGVSTESVFDLYKNTAATFQPFGNCSLDLGPTEYINCINDNLFGKKQDDAATTTSGCSTGDIGCYLKKGLTGVVGVVLGFVLILGGIYVYGK